MKCSSVIVDSRQIDNDLIADHLEFIPDYWDLHVWTSGSTKLDFECTRHIYTGGGGHDYNNFLMQSSFWKQLIDYDYVLIFQQDSMLLRNGIESFCRFDFIGAPLAHIKYPAMNGGLSIRKPTKMIECINRGLLFPGHNEDIRFSYTLNSLGGILPTKEVAMKFSCETIYSLNTLGYHAIESHLSENQVYNIKNQYL